MKLCFFPHQSDFRKWLEENHKTEKEILVGFHKVDSGKPSITWPESVDQALCYGWIDGIRRSIDKDSYCIRFTPRRPGSNWSAVNIKKVEELIKKGLMQPAGLELYNIRKVDKSEVYSYENKPEKLSGHLEQIFISNEKAWSYFSSQSISYQRTVMYWIMSAKREETRLSRLNKLILSSEQSKRLAFS